MAERRRQEIEEKKAKLAELRRARDERKALLAQAEQAGPSGAVQQVSKFIIHAHITETSDIGTSVGAVCADMQS